MKKLMKLMKGFGMLTAAALLFGGCPQTEGPEGPEEPGNLPLTADIVFYTGTYTSDTEFDTGSWNGEGTANETWGLTALEAPVVYFAVTKGAAQAITVTGTDVAKVITTAEDAAIGQKATAEGLTESNTMKVFAVETKDTLVDGGTRSFTLEVSEEGKAGKTVDVTLNVDSKEDLAVFIITRSEDGTETQARQNAMTPEFEVANTYYTKYTGEGTEPIESLIDAIKWVDTRTDSDTEYLIRVAAEENDLPATVLSCNGANNVTIRLRGTAAGPRILRYNGAASMMSSGFYGNFYNTNLPFASTGALITIGDIYNGNGYFTTETITLILERNITVSGIGIGRPDGNTISKPKSVFEVGFSFSGGEYQNTLIMREGSAITDFTGIDPVIYVYVGGIYDDEPYIFKSGRFINEGGAFENINIISSSSLYFALIYFEAVENVEYNFFIDPGTFVWKDGSLINTSSDEVRFAGTVEEGGFQYFIDEFTTFPVVYPPERS